MAKRFGRNQRRRMREQVANLEVDRDRWKRSAETESVLRERISEKHYSLKSLVDDWEHDARHLLGRYSAFLIETGQMKSSRLAHLQRMHLPSRLRAWDFATKIEEVAMDSYSTVELLQQLVRCDFDAVRLKCLVRVRQVDRFGNEDLHMAYRVDGRDLLRMGRRDCLALAEHIAREFEERANRGVSA